MERQGGGGCWVRNTGRGSSFSELKVNVYFRTWGSGAIAHLFASFMGFKLQDLLFFSPQTPRDYLKYVRDDLLWVCTGWPQYFKEHSNRNHFIIHLYMYFHSGLIFCLWNKIFITLLKGVTSTCKTYYFRHEAGHIWSIFYFSTWMFVRGNLCHYLLMNGINHHDKMPDPAEHTATCHSCTRNDFLASQLTSGKLILFNKTEHHLGSAVKIATICEKKLSQKKFY